MKQVMSHVDNVLSYVAWAGGFSAGTYVGMRIEERLALGTQVIRIITNQLSPELIAALRAANHGITVVDAEGSKGPVKMIFTVVKRTSVPDVIAILEQHQPNAFFSVEDVRNAHHGVFRNSQRKLNLVRSIFPDRKGK
jgi:uncharacterized protein YebE (UPF0316 family)